ncbi:Protein LURP-one-related 6 [Ananas comosus]|uniref:Protein LURP-one-related 6 n=1 Tax=Ananas comosus TaxID=4615 RepID=A0A199UPW6_ANACO|nr:Protein LURP-one-related 6 [Ananas comosus]
MAGSTILKPIVSKIYCSSSKAVLMVRKRPPNVNGGGLVVTDSTQKVVFSVDGCGILGAMGELIVRDGDGTAILFIHKRGGVVQALSIYNHWRGYLMDYDEPSKLVFSLLDPKSPLAMKNAVRILVEPKGRVKGWDLEVVGSFVERACTIKDRRGNVVAQMGAKDMMTRKDIYYVVMQPGYDQAFVIGVVAILDNIHGEATRC